VVFAMVAGVIGFLVAASGIVPIRASSGHWQVTRWFLNFSMRRSVKTHSVGTTIPMLNDPDLVLRGAGHFEIGCAPCHGSPAVPRPRLPQYMTPHPPSLTTHVSLWEPEELFHIVKHGVKFTGMPGWPSQHRDDECWAMVAFLLKLPDLTSGEYRDLAHGPLISPDDIPSLDIATSGFDSRLLDLCARCHGPDAEGRGNGAIPPLAGQKQLYLENALRAYAIGHRHSGTMETVASTLDRTTISALSRHYASLPRSPRNTAVSDAEARARGEAIAQRGIPERKVASCADCHGPDPSKPNEAYPALAGLGARYIVLQLELFASNNRGGSEYARIMKHVAPRLSEDERRDVAHYYATLPGPSSTNSTSNRP
jgi:cytochrome c553